MHAGCRFYFRYFCVRNTALVVLMTSQIAFHSAGEQSAGKLSIRDREMCSLRFRLLYTSSSKETSNALDILTGVGRLSLVVARSICEMLVGHGNADISLQEMNSV